jgi:hypothetical protein
VVGSSCIARRSWGRTGFEGERGVCHSVGVTAETLDEAAATALSIFKQSEWEDVIGPNTELVVAVKTGDGKPVEIRLTN